MKEKNKDRIEELKEELEDLKLDLEAFEEETYYKYEDRFSGESEVDYEKDKEELSEALRDLMNKAYWIIDKKIEKLKEQEEEE